MSSMSLKTHEGKIDPVRVVFGIGIVLVLIVSIWALYVSFVYATPPAEVKDIEVLTPQVEAGKNALVKATVCKYVDMGETLKRTWADNIIYHTHPVYPSGKNIGCSVGVIISIDVPDTLPPGIYTIKNTLEYQIAPWVKRDVHYDYGPIEVISKE